jgi:stage V sporulation protein SpoVS
MTTAAPVFRVSRATDPGSLGTSIARTLVERGGTGTARAMGNEAVGQLVKGIIIAKGQLAVLGKRLLSDPHYENQPQDEGDDLTVTVFNLELV